MDRFRACSEEKRTPRHPERRTPSREDTTSTAPAESTPCQSRKRNHFAHRHRRHKVCSRRRRGRTRYVPAESVRLGTVLFLATPIRLHPSALSHVLEETGSKIKVTCELAQVENDEHCRCRTFKASCAQKAPAITTAFSKVLSVVSAFLRSSSLRVYLQEENTERTA